MIGPENLDQLYLILAFIVPGLVIFFVRSKFITGRRPTHAENILTYLVLSVGYYALTIPFVQGALSLREPWFAIAGIWILLTLLGPAVLGLLLGVLAQKGYGSWIAEKLNITTVHVIPAAWDWRFSRLPRGGLFIMVTLTNDQMVAGFFGRNSFASSDETERDLYIEEEYDVTESGEWKPRPARVGILIPGREIRHVEFWDPA